MTKTTFDQTLKAAKNYTHPRHLVGMIAPSILRVLHKYCDIESMESLREFDHPKQLRNFRILGCEFGQFETIKNWDCVNASNKKIPWYTYPACEFVQSLDLRDLKITEFGSGSSSLFYLDRGAILSSIEGNEDWYNKIRRIAGGESRFTYKLCSDQNSYVEQESVTEADLVIIDGEYRNACAIFVCDSILKEQSNPGMLIFDNSDWYPKTIRSIDRKMRWQRVDFSGFGPINNYCWTTSIFFNPQKLSIGNPDIAPIAGIPANPRDDAEFA